MPHLYYFSLFLITLGWRWYTPIKHFLFHSHLKSSPQKASTWLDWKMLNDNTEVNTNLCSIGLQLQHKAFLMLWVVVYLYLCCQNIIQCCLFPNVFPPFISLWSSYSWSQLYPISSSFWIIRCAHFNWCVIIAGFDLPPFLIHLDQHTNINVTLYFHKYSYPSYKIAN